MFLRRYSKHKNGKDHAYWALVESYRTQAGSRQRIVSYLGELELGQESGWAQLCRVLCYSSRPRFRSELFRRLSVGCFFARCAA